MSRWSDNFSSHAYVVRWNELRELLSSVTVIDGSNIAVVQEIARLRKVQKYLDELLTSVDPELVPSVIWNSIDSQLSSLNQEIRNFTASLNIGYLQNANNHIDGLLTIVKPWSSIDSSANVNSLKVAIADYQKTVAEYNQSYLQKGKEILANLTERQRTVEQIEENLKDIQYQINTFCSELFDSTNGELSYKERVWQLVEGMEGDRRKIADFYHEALVGDENNNSIRKKMSDALQVIQNEKEAAQNLKDYVARESKELHEFYLKVFGDDGAPEGADRHGLKKEIDDRISQIDQFHIEQINKYNAQFEEIEGLVPGATSVGLASAFLEMRKSFDQPISMFTRMFYDAIALVVTLSVISMIQSIGSDGITFVHYETIGQFASTLGWKLPIVGAAVWLAVFASKRRSEAQRLQQEYAHKEALAKSYHGFKIQIEALGREDKEMLESLISKAIDSMTDNASKTLDGKHGDKTPLQELVETVAPSLEKIRKSVSGS